MLIVILHRGAGEVMSSFDYNKGQLASVKPDRIN